ncbi:MAG TPA: nucleoside hydrolase [Candidatus Dormibacteraeota bacterium]|nr:nucleoside hydrolase [Candidatus Dormibacteraeota bacterium]
MPDRIPLLLDVDTGIDDALALLYACASPEVDLLAVTCVGGNVDARQVAWNTRAVLELAGRADVPVHLGREQPLVKSLVTTPETHGPTGLGYALLPEPTRTIEAGEAADRIVELARSRPGELTLVTLGPLTNLAVALEREPALPSLLRALAIMGGAYRAPGNTTPTSEWNVHVDPEAARVVFAAWRPDLDGPAIELPLAMGLDVTEHAILRPGHLGALARRAGASLADAGAMASEPMRLAGSVAANPVLWFIGDALRFYFEFHERYDGFYGAFIHDPFALAAALDRSLVFTQPVHVDVETGPGLAHAMTVADWRGISHDPPNLDVAVAANADVFLERFIERVGGLAAARAAVAR